MHRGALLETHTLPLALRARPPIGHHRLLDHLRLPEAQHPAVEQSQRLLPVPAIDQLGQHLNLKILHTATVHQLEPARLHLLVAVLAEATAVEGAAELPELAGEGRI